jgi:mono/diheme cytochrome c family protein
VEVVGLLTPFLLLGIAVIFIAFSGGPGKAREAYLTRGGRSFRVAIPLLYLALGIGVPALVIAGREEATGGTAKLERKHPSAKVESGKRLFRETCASCHSLAAVNARGVTGPNLDKIGVVTKQRVLSAIRIGGTGQGRMPSGLLEGTDADEVATFVSAVAGK